MIGMSKINGAALEGNAHIAQSIADILSTPIGSRVHRRDYGSLLFDLIDRPLNAATVGLLQAATALAIARWEPRLRLRKVKISGNFAGGNLIAEISGDRTDLPAANTHVALSIPIRIGGAGIIPS
jgi:hypothetical protein